MEFLDDFLSQQESEDASDTDPAETPPEQAGDPTVQPVEQITPAVSRDEEAWSDLLESVTYDEPEQTAEAAKEKKPRKQRTKGKGMSTRQKIVLGILALLVIVLWIVVAVLIRRSTAARSITPAEVTVVSYTQVTPVSTEPSVDETSVEDDANTSEEVAVPAPTPTPMPVVFTEFDRQIQDNPDDIELYLLRADAYIQMGAYEAALSDLDIAKGMDETRAEIYVSEGWTSFYTGYWQRAEEALGTAVSFNEDLPQAHFGLGLILFYEGRYDEAAREFDWAAEINPSFIEAEAWLAIASAKLEDGEEAYGAVGRAISLTETSPIVYIAQSWARRTESPPDIDGAQADLLYAHDLKSNDFMTLNSLADFYLEHRPERLAEAELMASYAANWAVNDVERAVALQTLGRVYLQQDRQVDAERVFIEAVDLTSRDGIIHLLGLEEDLAKSKE